MKFYGKFIEMERIGNMVDITIYPIPVTNIKVKSATSSQHVTIKLAHLYSFLALLVCKNNLLNWGNNETLWFGAYSDQKLNIILSYINETIQWYQNTLTIYDLTTSYSALEFPLIYTIVNNEQKQQGQQCPTQITLYISSQFWSLDPNIPNTQDKLSVSIFHSLATFAGLPLKWGIYSENDARQFVQFDPNQTVNCAANYIYYLQSLIPIAKKLVEVYHCTFSTITCEHPSEFSELENNDEIYIKKNGSKVWPQGRYNSISAGQTLQVNMGFTTSIIQSDTLELWDADDISSDDLLYIYNLKPDSTIFGESRSSGTEQQLLQAIEGKKYVFFGKLGEEGPQAYYMTFSFDKKCLEIVNSQPVQQPPEDIIHDEL